MSKVYLVDSLYETVYFNTVKEAGRYKPGNEEPESVERLDAAEECNRLLRDVDDGARTIRALRMLLEDLVNVGHSSDLQGTQAWKRVVKFVEENPLPPADSADRDGQRSYGG